MILTALARLGRDAELRHTPKGDAVCELALAINYGRKQEDGNRPTQWLQASMWGQRAESLAPHLQKGKLLYVVVEEPHIETYEGKNGQGHKMVGRIVSLEFAGGGQQQDGQQRQSAPLQPPRQQPARPQQVPRNDFSDMDDDIPF
jgi:single-strand DNA-binding protein